MPFAHLPLAEFLDQVAAKTPAPGGGAVASSVGALAAALAQMSTNFSIGKKAFIAHQATHEAAIKELAVARGIMLQLADEDAEAYTEVNTLQKLPEMDRRRQAELPHAIRTAVQVPQELMAASTNLLRLFETLAPITNPYLKSDLAVAAILAEAAARAGAWNVRVNVKLLPEEDQGAILAELERSLADATARCRGVEEACK